MIFCADITVSGGYSGPLTLSFEVGSQYNGQTVTLLHAKNGKLMTYTAVVKNGITTFTVDSLSPFALFAVHRNRCDRHFQDGRRYAIWNDRGRHGDVGRRHCSGAKPTEESEVI